MNMLTAPFLETTKKLVQLKKQFEWPDFVTICPLAEKIFSFHTASPANMFMVCMPPDPTVKTKTLIYICAPALLSAII